MTSRRSCVQIGYQKKEVLEKSSTSFLQLSGLLDFIPDFGVYNMLKISVHLLGFRAVLSENCPSALFQMFNHRFKL